MIKITPQLRSEGKKICSWCKQIKPIDDFHSFTHKNGRDYRQSRCKVCSVLCNKIYCKNNRTLVAKKHREYLVRERNNGNLRLIIGKKLRSTRKEAGKNGYMKCTATVNELIPLFRTSCQICNTECGYGIHLDHCHETGKFRGFICGKCNSVAGYGNDDPIRLEAIVMYLRKDVQLTILPLTFIA